MPAIGEGINFAALLYRPIFDRLGRAAKLTLDAGVFDTMPDGNPLVALDKTIGVALPMDGGIILETVTPVAEFMIADLAAIGVTVDQLDEGILELNGKVWTIQSHRVNPSSSGESDGTVMCQLEGEQDT